MQCFCSLNGYRLITQLPAFAWSESNKERAWLCCDVGYGIVGKEQWKCSLYGSSDAIHYENVLFYSDSTCA